ncbi:MAG: helix-turn-helix domain-containing protein [Candidatus Thorarchaeota archaeon]
MSYGLSASALTVLQSLVRHGPMSPKEIGRKSKIPSRTVTDALRRLMKKQLVIRVPNLMNMRLCLYSLNLEVACRMVNVHGTDSMIGAQLTLLLRK